jgi:hypothetical protein
LIATAVAQKEKKDLKRNLTTAPEFHRFYFERQLFPAGSITTPAIRSDALASRDSMAIASQGQYQIKSHG